MFTFIWRKKNKSAHASSRNRIMRLLEFVFFAVLMLASPVNADAEKGRLHSPYGTTKIPINNNPTENSLTVMVGIPGDSLDILERANGWVKVSIWFNDSVNIGWVQEEYVVLEEGEHNNSIAIVVSADGTRKNPYEVSEMSISEMGALLVSVGGSIDEVLDRIVPQDEGTSPFQIKRDRNSYKDAIMQVFQERMNRQSGNFIKIYNLPMIPKEYRFSSSEFEICYGAYIDAFLPSGEDYYIRKPFYIDGPHLNDWMGNCSYSSNEFRQAVSRTGNDTLQFALSGPQEFHFPMKEAEAEALYEITRSDGKYKLMSTSVICEFRIIGGPNGYQSACDLVELNGIVVDNNNVAHDIFWVRGGYLTFGSSLSETSD